MGNKWTKQQLQAINETDSNILVAAAAGSGKTAVLVERIIKRIINDKIDIDKLLVVTFTNAAATEMRERILDAIYKKIDENKDNVNLQRQILLLNKSNISTIHAFCLDVIKNNFYKTDISPNFRLADTAEIDLLKQEVLEDVFDEFYEKQDKFFIDLVNAYGGYRDDEELKDIILRIYKFIQSTPFPEEWLQENVQKFNLSEKIEEDFSNTIWGKILINYAKEEILLAINILKNGMLILKKDDALIKYYSLIEEDICRLEQIINLDRWNDIYKTISILKFPSWIRENKTDCELKDEAKQEREKAKSIIKDIQEAIFIYDSKQANEDIYTMYELLKGIQEVILRFIAEYQKAKKEKNIIDFNDIEHYALNILVEKDENGKYIPSEIAKKYRDKFEEIAIDEYQDSNLVQEYILTTISRGNNIFMVGDIKQSIYKFRQARLELFLEKYDTYKDVEEKSNEGKRIQLFKNFRSRDNVLDITNTIFEDIMSRKIGNVDYDEKEFLNLGASYEILDDQNYLGNAEIHIIDKTSIKERQEEIIDGEDEQEELILENTEDAEIEAKFVANKIQEIIKSKCLVFDKNKKEYRKVRFGDIVILLRTTSNIAPIYEKELEKLKYPVFSDAQTNYFESIEIQTIMSLLKIVDNPNDDIPLVTVLRSPVVGLTDNELASIRVKDKTANFYELLYNSRDNKKIDEFLNLLDNLQIKQEYLSVDELLWYIYEKTGYYNYVSLMPDGEKRTANLKMLFEKAKDYKQGSFKGLYNFINFVKRVSKSGSDMGAPKLVGENENVIRIMSIHKSKGLEFPVVFLCGTGKQFNMQDLRTSILLHQDLGFGPKYINYERKIAYSTLAKEAIALTTKNEILSEEMRLLYVALTRSREKLIITGIDKNLEKSMQDKENMLSMYNEESKTNEAVISKAKSYLDWLETVLLFDKKINDMVTVNYHKNLKFKEKTEDEDRKICIEKNNEISKEIKNILEWEYTDLDLTKIEGKSSVSKIAKDSNTEIKITPPSFMQDDINLSGAEIGTAVHLVMQKLDFNEEYNEDKIRKLIESLAYKNIITNKEKEAIDIQKILKFTKSNLFSKIQKSKQKYIEEPFYINIPANEIYETDAKESVLVQGVIDLYFVNEKDNIVLVDYKTDYVPNRDENYLKEKYSKQLELYKKALENGTKRKVKEVYIYSTYLEKEIKF